MGHSAASSASTTTPKLDSDSETAAIALAQDNTKHDPIRMPQVALVLLYDVRIGVSLVLLSSWA